MGEIRIVRIYIFPMRDTLSRYIFEMAMEEAAPAKDFPLLKLIVVVIDIMDFRD